MIIWYNRNLKLKDLESIGIMGMSAHLGMKWEEVGKDYIKMSMPVDDTTKQPYGLLHGGASCALAESIGSIASFLVIDTKKYSCVGLEINANHIRAARTGRVTATCTPLHLGRSTHVWDIRIQDDDNRVTCISRLTMAIVAKSF